MIYQLYLNLKKQAKKQTNKNKTPIKRSRGEEARGDVGQEKKAISRKCLITQNHIEQKQSLGFILV